jgi:plastocyanin
VDSNAPADAGEVIVLYGTGFGPTNPPTKDGQVVTSPLTLANPVRVLVGGVQAEVMFAGLVGPGLFQINVKIPAGVPSGDAAIVAEVGGARSPEGIFIAARANQPPLPPSMYSADINNFKFLPPTIDVAVGGTLTWTNKQGVGHTVISNAGKFGSVVLGQNDTFSFKFTAPGTYAYHCSIHPLMKATVVVK